MFLNTKNPQLYKIKYSYLRFILLVRSDFHIIDSLLIAVHAFVNLVSMSFSVDATLLPR